MLNHLFVYICNLKPNLMLAKILQPMLIGLELSWITRGTALNPYQRKILDEEGISAKKWTKLLFEDETPVLVDLLKVCKITGVNIEEVIVHYK